MIMHEQGTGPVAADEVRLLDLGAVVLRRWRLVAGVTLATVLLAVGFSMLRPRMYKARVVMLPPQQQQSAGRAEVLASQLSGLPGVGSVGSSNQRVIGVIARSQALSDTLVARVGATRNQDRAAVRELLGRHTEVEEKSDGSVVVEVSGRDPRLAAEVANAFPPAINTVSALLGTEAAMEKEAFLETQLARARERLERSEAGLVAFQKGRNAPDIQEQARQTVDATAALQQQIAAQELRVNQLSRSSTPANPALRAAISDLNALRDQMRRLSAGGGGHLFVPLQDAPDLRATTTRLTREYTKDERVYLSLTAALADAQIAVNNTLAVVSVLDRAAVPAEPTGAGTLLIVAVAGLLGVLLGLVTAFVVERLARARQEPEGRSFFEAWEEFKGDLRRGGLPRRAHPGAPLAGRGPRSGGGLT